MCWGGGGLFNSEPNKGLRLTTSLASRLPGTGIYGVFLGGVWWVAGGFEESGGVSRSILLASELKIGGRGGRARQICLEKVAFIL